MNNPNNNKPSSDETRVFPPIKSGSDNDDGYAETKAFDHPDNKGFSTHSYNEDVDGEEFVSKEYYEQLLQTTKELESERDSIWNDYCSIYYGLESVKSERDAAFVERDIIKRERDGLDRKLNSHIPSQRGSQESEREREKSKTIKTVLISLSIVLGISTLVLLFIVIKNGSSSDISEASQEQVRVMKTALDEARAERSETQELNNKMQGEIDSLNSRISSDTDTITKMQEEINKKNDSIKLLETQIQELSDYEPEVVTRTQVMRTTETVTVNPNPENSGATVTETLTTTVSP